MVHPSDQHTEDFSSEAPTSKAGPLPRAPHKRRKPERDRGLPNDLELSAFAEEFLKAARTRFPHLAKSGHLPVSSPAVLGAMVEDFKERHRGRQPDVEEVKAIKQADPALKLAIGYFRYSCDNSNPTSITDQMTNCVKKAAEEGRFIPWQFIYADYSVTGRDSSRLGYQSAKKAIENPENKIDTLYIDDFTRASRDTLEWWRLAAVMRRLKKRMIGASDQFDLSKKESDLLISVFTMLSRLFVQSLQQKVMRGMLGAAGRGTVVGKLPLGFARRPICDANGCPILGGDGKPTHEICIDPATAPIRRLMYELFVHQQWPVQRIRKHFNTLKMDGWNGWTNKAIRNLLASATAIGQFAFNKTGREFNEETEQWEIKEKPPEEHRIYEDPALALISVELWEAAQVRLAEIHAAHEHCGHRKGRNQANPTTLFSGTLFCACCQKELKLVRSVGKFRQLGSLDGILGIHDCQLTSSKSVKIIETSLLETLQEVLLTDELVEGLVAQANQILEEEATQPAPEITEQQARLRQIDAEIKRLVRRSAATDDDGLAASYELEIKRLQTEAAGLQAEVKAAQTSLKLRSERLDMASAKQLLSNLRGVLNEDPATAGLALRRLTGRIQVRQEPIPATQGRYRWIATFTPQYSQLLAQLAPLGCGEFLAAKADLPAKPLEVVLDQLPRYERMAPEVKRLHDKGSSLFQIASALGMVWEQVKVSLHFAQTGERPINKPKRQRTGKGPRPRRYVELAPDVVKLREKKWSFAKIAEHFKVAVSTVQRAFGYAKQADAVQAAEAGTRMSRGHYAHLSEEVRTTIVRLAAEGKSATAIAKEVGCNQKTVGRYLNQERAGYETVALP